MFKWCLDVSSGDILSRSFNLYLSNLVIVAPMVVAVILDTLLIGVLSLFFFGFAFARWPLHYAFHPYSLFAGFFLLIALVSFLVFMVNTVAGGVVADMSWRIVERRPYSLESSFNYVKQFVPQLIVAGVATGILILVLSLIPVVGTAVGTTLFAPLPLLIVRGRDVVDSLRKSVELVVDSVSRRFEVPLVSFIIFLVGVAGGWAFQLLVTLVGYPYVVLLYALYMSEVGVY